MHITFCNYYNSDHSYHRYNVDHHIELLVFQINNRTSSYMVIPDKNILLYHYLVSHNYILKLGL